jgi:hypothetical protein
MYLKLNKFLSLLVLIIFISINLNSCGIYKKSNARKVSPNVDERVKQNIEEGKGVGVGSDFWKKGGDFQFASANELWRASIDVLDFLPLSNVDYSGGVIITDWYNEGTASGESIKITVRFLSNQIRSDAITVIVHKKKCNNTSSTQCSVAKINNSALEDEIRLAILKKATLLKKDSLAKRRREYRKKYGETDLTKEKRYID